MRVRRADDGQYRLIAVVPPPAHFDLWESLWHFLWLPILIAVLCYLLAVDLVSPLRNLRKVVERFGRGELGARFRADPEGRDRRAGASIQPDGGSDHDVAFGGAAVAAGRFSRAAITPGAARLCGRAGQNRATIARRPWPADSPGGRSASRNWSTSCCSYACRGRPDRPGCRGGRISASCLARWLPDCELEAEARGCRLEAKIDATAVVTGDFELLQRACENVLRNAIRHDPEGSRLRSSWR